MENCINQVEHFEDKFLYIDQLPPCPSTSWNFDTAAELLGDSLLSAES